MAEHTNDPLRRPQPTDEQAREKSPYALQPDGPRVERNIDAMEIRIDYRVRPGNVTCEIIGKECRFRQDEESEFLEELDPYLVRAAFEKVGNEVEALQFLKHAGKFWPMVPVVTWRQFQEWQEFTHLIRQHDFLKLASNNERANQAMLALGGYPNNFFTAPDCPKSDNEKKEFTRQLARLTETVPESASRFAELREEREKAFYRLRGLFRKPPAEAITTGYKADHAIVTVMKRDARAGVFSHLTPIEFLAQEYALKPIINIRARTVLEAIAATIYADRRHGLKIGKCGHCKQLFEKQSELNTTYCPNKGCKNAASQKAWRMKDKARREQERRQAANTLTTKTPKKAEKKNRTKRKSA
jgi:hypothetical protein